MLPKRTDGLNALNSIRVVAEWIRAPDSSSGVSDQQSFWVRVPVVTLVSLSKTQTMIASSFGWDVKPLVPCIV